VLDTSALVLRFAHPALGAFTAASAVGSIGARGVGDGRKPFAEVSPAAHGLGWRVIKKRIDGKEAVAAPRDWETAIGSTQRHHRLKAASGSAKRMSFDGNLFESDRPDFVSKRYFVAFLRTEPKSSVSEHILNMQICETATGTFPASKDIPLPIVCEQRHRRAPRHSDGSCRFGLKSAHSVRPMLCVPLGKSRWSIEHLFHPIETSGQSNCCWVIG
jgi:hypothetical protein